ncbi:MAG TPA: DUF2330 domain-containing protein, partial [Herpetosiphonaceae bacterium]|nr:DUF2330 domain-containing protein [Herpetosiphonaceae bacterium]
AQAAGRVIFAVDSQAGEITAYMQISYAGDAQSFAWLVPVPGTPTVETADLAAFDELSALTSPRLVFPPPQDCFTQPAQSSVAGESVAPAQAEPAGSYEYAVIDGSDPAAVPGWLRDNGYQVAPEAEPLIKSYADAGMSFVAMKVTAGQGAGAIQPVAITYRATEPTLPIRLGATAAGPGTSITAWVFAERQATPANTTRLTMRKNDLALTDLQGGNNYAAMRSGAIDSLKGQGFVIEYAQPTSQITATDPLVQRLAARHPYLTRLYGEMAPEEMTADPVFEIKEGLPDIPAALDMSNRIPPFDCETQQLQTVRRQQNDAAKGPGRASPEEATKDLRRGPLAVITIIFVAGILALIWWLGRKPRRA